MADTIGNITVPEIAASGTFPIVPEYPYGRASHPDVAIHQFGSGNAKIEQRFLLGTGARRFTVRRTWMNDTQRIALRNFWESKYGPYGAFTYNAPNDDGNGTTAFTCRFANEPLSWADGRGLDLLCRRDAGRDPRPRLRRTRSTRPSPASRPAALQTALLSQVQQVVPLIKIQPLQAGYPAIYLSDRRCTVGGQLYQARLIDFDGISQGMGNESDDASFTFGNADRVMRDLANDVDLYRATISFSLFHVGTGIKLDLWKGDIVNWSCDAGPEFKVTASDGLYELNLPYPTRKISRTCWKVFDSQACPYADHGALDLVHFPDADANSVRQELRHAERVPRARDEAVLRRDHRRAAGRPDQGQLDRRVGLRAVHAHQRVAGRGFDLRPSAAGGVHRHRHAGELQGRGGPGRERLLRGVGDRGRRTARGVHADRTTRTRTATATRRRSWATRSTARRTTASPPTTIGLRTVLGDDPAGAGDFFSLDQSGNQTGGDFRKVYSGNSTFKDNFAAGTAFIVIRRSDAKGLQLSNPGDHAMIATVSQGMRGWVWTSPGVRVYGPCIINPVWIAVNMVLRARGLRLGADATTAQLNAAEALFDVQAAIDAAAICNDSVTKMVGVGSETQFAFRGTLQEEKPLRDWLQEVLMNCLGYYTFSFGKLRIGIRENSSVVEAFTEGNILFRSLQLAPAKPSFNHLTANFADQDFAFVNNSVAVYDIDHASLRSAAARVRCT